MTSEETILYRLNPNFQRNIFKKLINKHGSSTKSFKILKIPPSSIRGYKNLYFKSIRKSILEKLIDLNITNQEDLNKNTLEIFNKQDEINKILNYGRKIRRLKLEKFKNDIPPLKAIIYNNELDLTKWIEKYRKLLESGFRKVNIIYNKKFISIKHSNFTRAGLRTFNIKIPKKVSLDKEFLYFFGLWCGDRAGGKRFGIVNKNKQILEYTKNFLKRYNQKIEKILYITKGLPEPKIDYHKKFIINKKIKGWALSLHSNNGVLSSFFHYLQLNLVEFMSLIKNKYPFFAGLFDAEGNVALETMAFKWACKNRGLVDIYSSNLTKLNIYNRYDGGCIITYDRERFYKEIFPYLKHEAKINATNFLCKGKGELPTNYLRLLKHISNNPKNTVKMLSKALKIGGLYNKLRLLKKFKFVGDIGYPHKIIITAKGLKSIGVD